MRAAALILALGLAVASPAAAEVDFSKLTFPRDAQALIADPGAFHDALEYLEDKTQAAVKRLYAASFMSAIIENCSEESFWANLKNLPTTASAYLNEMRADRDLDSALPHARHVRETLKHGARSLGRQDAATLVAQGICQRFKP